MLRGVDIRGIIVAEMKRQKLSSYMLAKRSGLGERGVLGFVRGDNDVTSGRLGLMLAALGLTIVQKNPKKPPAKAPE